MGRTRSSGLFETILKSAFKIGTTVHYKENWLGQKQKVVKHHDTGKKKTYTHGCGLFGNVTKTKTERGWRTIERGRLKENLLFGATERARRSDGTTVETKYKPGFIRDHVETQITGQCRTCSGTGTFQMTGKPCRRCGGTGLFSKTNYK